jgi:hypothetical protein
MVFSICTRNVGDDALIDEMLTYLYQFVTEDTEYRFASLMLVQNVGTAEYLW